MLRLEKLLSDRAAEQRRNVARALMRGFMGPSEVEEGPLVLLASQRLEEFLGAVGNQSATLPLRILFNVLYGYVKVRYRVSPDALSEAQLAAFMRELHEPDAGPLGRFLLRVAKVSPMPIPSMRDLTRGMRAMITAAYYGTPDSDFITGYRQIWQREEALALLPELKAPPVRVPVVELLEKQREGSDVRSAQLFAYDGRPRVAIIGSGAGGAVAAAKLAETCDVAVFEAGPSFTPTEYPTDTLSGMALLFRDGLMTFTQGQTLQLLLGRLVGGGTVLTSGMSIRTRKSTLAAWQRAGLDLGAMSYALDSVEKRCRMKPVSEDVVSDLGRLWRGQDVESDLMFEVPLANVVTHQGQHDPRSPHRAHQKGERCIACGLCNYGCRFGHKLSVELTYLLDAKAKGARVHANLPVHRLVARREPDGSTRVTGLILERDKHGLPITVDHVVLAAGAVGSPQLLQRSMRADPVLQKLACAEQVGQRLGFNYGTTVVADFGTQPKKPGDAGVQIHYVASKPDDERYVLENAYLPPALMASVVPGHGAMHRDWMKAYRRLSMIAVTIGSPQSGAVLPNGQVRYEFSDSELEVIHESIATSVRSYLRAGTKRVALAGVRGFDESANIFYPGEESSPRKLLDKVRRIAPDTDRLMMMSAHPQGGLIMGKRPEDSVVDSHHFHVHGVRNLAVADASLFPSTIVVNPQWTVMSLAKVAGDAIAEQIAREWGGTRIAARIEAAE